jgi:hypothetical protein
MKTIAELRTQIGLWSEREDIPDTQIDHFINLCEQEYKDDLYLPPNEKLEILTTKADGSITIPQDYLKTKHMYILDTDGNKRPLYRKPNELVVTLGSFGATNGISYFERSGSDFIFAPDPGEGVDVYVTYYGLIPSLLDIEQVDPDKINFVMSVMPTIYLFGALMFLHMYTYNEERANYYAKLYDRAKKDLIGMQADAEMSGSSLHVVPTLSDDGSTW